MLNGHKRMPFPPPGLSSVVSLELGERRRKTSIDHNQQRPPRMRGEASEPRGPPSDVSLQSICKLGIPATHIAAGKDQRHT